MSWVTAITKHRLGACDRPPRPDDHHDWIPLDRIDIDGERKTLWARWHEDINLVPTDKGWRA